MRASARMPNLLPAGTVSCAESKALALPLKLLLFLLLLSPQQEWSMQKSKSSLGGHEQALQLTSCQPHQDTALRGHSHLHDNSPPNAALALHLTLRPHNGDCSACREAARELETIFERAWTTAGLTLDGPSPSQAADSMGAASMGGPRSPRALPASGPASPALLNRRASAEGMARQNMLGSQLSGRDSLGHHADPSAQSCTCSCLVSDAC